MKFLVLAASHRPESYNRKLAKIAGAYLSAAGMDADIPEYGTFDMPVYNDTLNPVPAACRAFGEHAAHANGLIFCVPEYNWSYPGSLKTILEWTSRLEPNPLAGKTALLACASPSARGGIVGLQHLKSPLEALQLFVYPKVLALGHAPAAFDEQDRFKEKKQTELFNALLSDYITFTRKLTT